jgi:hypothetical protein
MTKKSLQREITAAMKRIASERDKLRDLIADAEGIAECCDNAIDSLTMAADTLSEYL